MNKKKQHHFDKLQKSSILFTQLGLVLALLVVYLALEFSTVKKDLVINNSSIPDESTPYVTQYPDVDIEKKLAPKVPVKPKKLVQLTNIEVKDNNPNIEESVIGPIDETPIAKLIGSIVEIPNDEDDGEPLPFTVIEEVPIYPGCEGLNEEESKKCFTKEIAKFVNKKFNTDLVLDLNLTGKQRIFVLFKIDKNGTVTDILARAPHKSLEKEAVRIVQKLPQMTPGKQRKRPVGVKYTLPIVFFIE